MEKEGDKMNMEEVEVEQWAQLKRSQTSRESKTRAEARLLFPRMETGPKWPRSAARLCT